VAPVCCPFCALPAERLVARWQAALAFRDAFPVSNGHTLIITRRHVASFFETTAEEKADLLALLGSVKARLDVECRPDGYTIGINDGAAAGQTIEHLHIHLIPRYRGDQPDPRGGVRRIFPDKADYWTPR
jgi:diadenosine tetraphosphate (Ap4A) HIT family hydrolase